MAFGQDLWKEIRKVWRSFVLEILCFSSNSFKNKFWFDS